MSRFLQRPKGKVMGRTYVSVQLSTICAVVKTKCAV